MVNLRNPKIKTIISRKSKLICKSLVRKEYCIAHCKFLSLSKIDLKKTHCLDIQLSGSKEYLRGSEEGVKLTVAQKVCPSLLKKNLLFTNATNYILFSNLPFILKNYPEKVIFKSNEFFCFQNKFYKIKISNKNIFMKLYLTFHLHIFPLYINCTSIFYSRTWKNFYLDRNCFFFHLKLFQVYFLCCFTTSII